MDPTPSETAKTWRLKSASPKWASRSLKASWPSGSRQKVKSVSADEPLVEVETDKITVEVPAPAAGVLRKQAAGEGDTVNVGDDMIGEIEEGAGAARRATERRNLRPLRLPLPPRRRLPRPPREAMDTPRSCQPPARRPTDAGSIRLHGQSGTGRGRTRAQGRRHRSGEQARRTTPAAKRPAAIRPCGPTGRARHRSPRDPPKDELRCVDAWPNAWSSRSTPRPSSPRSTRSTCPA